VTVAYPLPAWALTGVVAAALVVAWLAYRRVPIVPARRYTLSALRALTLLWIVVCLMRPLGAPAAGLRDAVVPILVDTSRSMGLTDAGGDRRIDEGRDAIDRELLPAIAKGFHPELLRFGDRVAASPLTDLSATDRRTALADARNLFTDRYSGRPLAGIVLVSDGGDNASRADRDDVLAMAQQQNVTIYTIGLFNMDDRDADPGVLKKLARETGGERFLPRSPGPLLAAVEHIAREIREVYTIGYAPPEADGNYHRVRVTVNAPDAKHLDVRTRPGYFAARRASIRAQGR